MGVLSPSTKAQDRWEKMRAYLDLETLEAYLLLDPERKGLEGYGYFREGKGLSLRRYPGGQVPLPCLDTSLGLEAIYPALG